jgi:hypothetical protein
MVLVVWSGHWSALSSTSPATVPASIAIQLFPKGHIEFVENEYRLAVQAQPPNKSVLGTRESFSVNQALSRTARLDRHRPMCIVMAWVKETVKWTPTSCHRIRLCEQVYRVLVEQVKGVMRASTSSGMTRTQLPLLHVAFSADAAHAWRSVWLDRPSWTSIPVPAPPRYMSLTFSMPKYNPFSFFIIFIE